MTYNKIKKENFPKRLKQLMAERNETIYTIAEIVDLHPSTISKYINQKMTPKITTVKIISQFFGINPAWLMGYDVEKNLNFKKSVSKEEKKLIEEYRKLTNEQKFYIKGQIDAFLINDKQKKAKKGDTG